MKTRFGFVSNSSSSSFILPLDKNCTEVNITIPLETFEEMFEDDGDETSINALVKTQDELKKYLIDTYMIDEENFYETLLEDDYIEGIYRESLEFIKDGKMVIFGDVAYHDRGLETLLKKLGAKISS